MIELKEEDVNTLFGIVSTIQWEEDVDTFTFTEEMLNDNGQYDDDEQYDKFQKLIGYHVEFEQDGDHRNDGQFVDYTINLTSPTGEETTIVTEMCLMVGYNHHKNEIIK